jgi:hypothetical protein
MASATPDLKSSYYKRSAKLCLDNSHGFFEGLWQCLRLLAASLCHIRTATTATWVVTAAAVTACTFTACGTS